MSSTPRPPGNPDQASPDAVLSAAALGDISSLIAALDAGAAIEARDAKGRSPLLLAVLRDDVSMAQVLLERGADPNAIDDRNDTPWLATGVTGSVAMLETLLPAGPDLTLRNRYGGVSIIPASERGHVEYVRRVAQTGIDVNHLNDLRWTALLEAVILGDGSPVYQEIVAILLAAGADPLLADRDGVTAHEHAVRLGQAAVAALLP
ncbi:MAG: ankyrin repeat domain-containing protein [Ilumatobacteraceae bacterium]